MIENLEIVTSVLDSADYSHFVIGDSEVYSVGFENDLCLGFIFCYETTEDLLDNWERHSDIIFSQYKFQLRNAGEKSWNAYTVFLSFGASTTVENNRMSRIEENLTGTRKIARAVSPDLEGIRSGLLPLLRIQNPPILGTVDMIDEIKARASGLPWKAVEAFLKAAPNSEILRLMGRSDET